MRHIISALLLTVCAFLIPSAATAAISGEWRAHPAFDNSALQVIDTPERVYFMGYSHTIQPAIAALSAPDCSLFFMDKDSDEIRDAYNAFGMASTSVRYIEYNPYRKYLFVAYDDNNIDLLLDSGECVNISALKNASIPGSKAIRSASFDREKNILWVATDFGYVAIDDKNYTVKESRNYSIPLDCVASVGDNLLVIYNGHLYSARTADPRMNFSDYAMHDTTPAAKRVYPIDSNLFILHANAAFGNNIMARYKIAADGTPECIGEEQLYYVFSVSPSSDGGYRTVGVANGYNFISDKGTVKQTTYRRPAEDKQKEASGSWDCREFFTLIPRQGLRSYKNDALGSTNFALSRDARMPNTTPVHYSRAMAHHPRYGALVSNIGLDASFDNNNLREAYNLSSLKNGEWTRHGFVYTNPEQAWVGFNPIGLLVDPQDDRYVYTGSRDSGMTRINLDDPQDIIHYSFDNDPTKNLPGYVEANPVQERWSGICPNSAPRMDANGNLWTYHYLHGETVFEMQYLTAADRKASTSAANARPFRKLRASTKGNTLATLSIVLPLTYSTNSNYILYIDNTKIMVLDHKGTLENTSDDQVVVMQDFTDQDGGRVSLYLPGFAYEDQQTGMVWFGTSTGIYYVQPKNLLQGQAVVNRVKIARNDGTTLADYLLNGVGVNGMTEDASGRKWIGSIGGGVVVTSSDCKTIIAEFTAANSGLLSDNIYTLRYMPSTNSVMISTDRGLCEFFIGGSADRPALENEVRAYPNPVTPDYYGWVTIDGLPDNALVKIVDAQGNLVRELGRAEAGSIQWDVYNLHHQRVKTGVYYVLSSSTGGGESNLTKILVMN